MTEKEFNKLLDKFLEGNTSPEEDNILSEFEDFSFSKESNNAFRSDLEKREIQQEIYRNIRKGVSGKRNPWIQIAVAIIFIVLFTITFYTSQSNTEFLTMINDSDTFKIVQLEDGSSVTLREQSSIRFSNNYNGMRYLELEGEGFFEIARDEKKPFVVKVGPIQTKVLGTSFNIKETDSIIDVSVATGLIEVADTKTSLKIRPDQRTEYNLLSQSFKVREIDHNLFTFWYKNTIKLKAVTMEDLAELLQSRYGVAIKFKNEAAKKVQMTLSIEAHEDLASVLQKINYISELKLTKSQNHMIEVN